MQTRSWIGAVLLAASVPTFAFAQPTPPATSRGEAPPPASPPGTAPVTAPAPAMPGAPPTARTDEPDDDDAPASTDAPAAPTPATPPATVATAEPVPPPAVEVDTEAPAPSAWYDALGVHGFASVAYSFNANRPAEETNQMRVFDTDDGTINVDVIELVVLKPAAAIGEAGFRVDLTAGSTVPQATASAGLFRDEEGAAEDVDLQQAFVSYVADVGDGLRLDIGKFVTHMGYELIEGYDGYNDHYSRSVLFGYAIPFTHTGAKVSYPITSSVSGMLMVANGWDNVKDNNGGKTFGAQLAAVVGPASAWLNVVSGPEQTGDTGNWRHVVDVVATVKPIDPLTLGINGDLGFEDSAAADGDAMWMGAALYATWAATDAVSIAARGEVFRDRDGARTLVPQTIVEGTLSPAVRLGDRIVLRGDLRVDRSTEPVFMTESATSRQQVTFAVNALGILSP